MAKISFLTCPHENVQQFTEYCFDCGYNIWTTEKEYLKDLRKQAGATEIDKLEKKLGIKKNKNS
jgi:predicted transcriptional regulator